MKWHEMCLPSFVTPQGEKDVNIKLHIPVYRFTCLISEHYHEVRMKNMSDKMCEQKYRSALLKQNAKNSLKMHDLDVETDVKTNGKGKKRSLRKLRLILHHPLGFRNETMHSNQNDQCKPSHAMLPER